MIDASLRQLRLMHFIFLAVSAYIVAVTELLIVRHVEPVEQTGMIAGVLGVVAFGEIGFALALRGRALESARETLRTRPEDGEAIAKWRGTQFLSFAIAESVILLGMVVRLMSGERLLAVPFWAVGFAVLLMWTPQRPE